MTALLIALRDLVVALALAWVGVSFEQRAGDAGQCAGTSCQGEQSR